MRETYSSRLASYHVQVIRDEHECVSDAWQLRVGVREREASKTGARVKLNAQSSTRRRLSPFLLVLHHQDASSTTVASKTVRNGRAIIFHADLGL